MEVEGEEREVVEDEEVQIDFDAVLDEQVEGQTHDGVGEGDADVEAHVDEEHEVEGVVVGLVLVDSLLDLDLRGRLFVARVGLVEDVVVVVGAEHVCLVLDLNALGSISHYEFIED